MNHLSLFSGIGGFDLAARWMGWENVAHVEKNPFCRKILKQHFPKSKSYEDIKEFKGQEYRGKIDIISGGFPCQPFSVAGKQGSKNDDRYLWPEMLRVIQEIKPSWIVAENVSGIIKLALDEVLSSLEDAGYSTEVYIIPACAVNAFHRRDRVWIVGHSNDAGQQQGNEEVEDRSPKQSDGLCIQPHHDTNACRSKLQRSSQESVFGIGDLQGQLVRGSEALEIITHATKSRVCGVTDGFPGRVDRIKALGNAIVPQVAYQIFKAIDSL